MVFRKFKLILTNTLCYRKIRHIEDCFFGGMKMNYLTTMQMNMDMMDGVMMDMCRMFVCLKNLNNCMDCE